MTEARKITLQFPSLRAFLAEYGERISPEGMLLRGEAPPAAGTTVDIEVVVAAGMRLLRARGETLWSGAAGAGSRQRAAAVRFLDLDDASRTLIAKIVDQRRREGAEPFRLEDVPGPREARLRDLTVPAAAIAAGAVETEGPSTDAIFDLAGPAEEEADPLAPLGAGDTVSAGLETAGSPAETPAPAAPAGGGPDVFDLDAPEAQRPEPPAVARRPKPPVPLLADPEPTPFDLGPMPAAADQGSEPAEPAPRPAPQSESGERPGSVTAAEADLDDLFGGDAPQREPARGRTEAFPASFVDEVEAELRSGEPSGGSYLDIDTSELEIQLGGPLDEPGPAAAPSAEAQAPAAETPVDGAPADEASDAEKAVAEKAVSESPVSETPVADLPVSETRVSQTPVSESPVVESPVAEAPVVEASVGGISAEDAPPVDLAAPAIEAGDDREATPAGGRADAPEPRPEPASAPAAELEPDAEIDLELRAEQEPAAAPGNAAEPGREDPGASEEPSEPSEPEVAEPRSAAAAAPAPGPDMAERVAQAFDAADGRETVEIPVIGPPAAPPAGRVPSRRAAVQLPPGFESPREPARAAPGRPAAPPPAAPRAAPPRAAAIEDNLLSIPELQADAPPAAVEPADPAQLPSSAEALRGAAGPSRHLGTWLLIALLAGALAVAGYFLWGLFRDDVAAVPPISRPNAPVEPLARSVAAPARPAAEAGPGTAAAEGAGGSDEEPAAAPPAADRDAGPAPAVAPAETEPSAAAGDPAAPFTGLDRITWSESGEETLLALVGDGAIARQSVELVTIGGQQPRLVIKLAGVQRAFQPAVLEVGTSQVDRVRSGLHAGGELHVVVDLAGAGVSVSDLAVRGARVEVRLGSG